MKFKNQTLSTSIDAAIIQAEKLFNPTSPMMLELMRKNDWKYDSGDGVNVFTKLRDFKGIIPIFTYRPKWPWTKAVGYSDKEGIHINVYRLSKLNFNDLVGLLLHEAAHQVGFHHNSGITSNRKTKDKCQTSVPYFLSENVEKWL